MYFSILHNQDTRIIHFGYNLWILLKSKLFSQLSIKCPQSGIKAHFMNVLLTVTNEDDGMFIMQKDDKRRELPFNYSQFIKFKSNRPVKHAFTISVHGVIC